MRLNQNLKLVGENIILVPYKKKHVSKYHEWMKSEELQQLTASEPLSLQNEYEMQKSWLHDDDKCTFIILQRRVFEEGKGEIESMIGDTNIFIKHHEDRPIAEVEIMIAEEQARGKHLGWESIIMMLIYSILEIKLSYFQAKISIDNEKSISLFKKLGFTECSRSMVFNEVTLEKTVSEEWKSWLLSHVQFNIEPYEQNS